MTRTHKVLILTITLVLCAAWAQEIYAQVRLQQLKMEKHADELIRIARTAEWLANKSPRYEQFSNEFVRAAETIVSKSKAKNIDGVTLAYFDLTMSCVRCHQYVREVRDARGPSMPEQFAVASNNAKP
jgi:hypothetical protein